MNWKSVFKFNGWKFLILFLLFLMPHFLFGSSINPGEVFFDITVFDLFPLAYLLVPVNSPLRQSTGFSVSYKNIFLALIIHLILFAYWSLMSSILYEKLAGRKKIEEKTK